MVWLTDKRRLVLFQAGTIVRDPHHLSLGFVKRSCSVVITTAPYK